MTVSQASSRRSLTKWLISDDLGWWQKLRPVANSLNIWYILPMYSIVSPYIFTLYMMFYLNCLTALRSATNRKHRSQMALPLSVSGWTRGVQVKLWDPLRMRAIPEHLRGVFTTRHYTNPRLPLPLLIQICLKMVPGSCLCKSSACDCKSWQKNSH